MTVLTDPVTTAYFDFLTEHAQRLLTDTFQQILSAVEEVRPHVIAQRDHTNAALDTVVLESQRIFAMIQEICRRHDRARLLLLFRKTSPQWAADLLRVRGTHPQATDVSMVFSEAMLFGTNCILSMSNEARPMTMSERFDFAPSHDELADAIRLALLCLVHRHNVFFANSVARRAFADPVSLDSLLTSYNNRQQRMRAARATNELLAVVLPASALQFRREDLLRQVPDGKGGAYTIWLRHYVPVTISMAATREVYGYLAGKKGFAQHLGCAFDTWLKVWAALNAVLAQNLHITPSAPLSPETLYFHATRLDEYGDSAMTGCPVDSLIAATSGAVAVLFRDPPTAEECRTVVTRLTYDGVVSDVRFTEQSFVFYAFTGGLVLWDGLRHGGLLRSIARTLAHDTSDATHQGQALETSIVSALRERLQIRAARGVKLKRQRNVVWELDVVFVWRGVLFVIEAKNEIKNIAYFFESDDIRSRVERVTAHLRKQDRMLRAHASTLRATVRDAEQTEGAIAVVCSREVEFIPSLLREWWLTTECPRVCRLEELLETLPALDADALRAHPAFVPWPE